MSRLELHLELQPHLIRLLTNLCQPQAQVNIVIESGIAIRERPRAIDTFSLSLPCVRWHALS